MEKDQRDPIIPLTASFIYYVSIICVSVILGSHVGCVCLVICQCAIVVLL